MTTSPLPQPVKGMKFKHATRKTWNGQPVEGTVTSVSKDGTVYWRDPLWSDRRMKTSLHLWEKFCAEVTYVPEAKGKGSAPRLSRSECEALHARAHAAGLEAGNSAVPTPMVPVERANPLDDTSPVVRQYAPVLDGVCGFAWVNVRPGNSAYARWASANLRALKGYTGGTDIWVRGFGQSYERKMAYAVAYAEVLTEAGLQAFADGRLD